MGGQPSALHAKYRGAIQFDGPPAKARAAPWFAGEALGMKHLAVCSDAAGQPPTLPRAAPTRLGAAAAVLADRVRSPMPACIRGSLDPVPRFGVIALRREA